MKKNNDAILNSSVYLKLFPKEIYINEKVQKLNQKSTTKERNLIVSIGGIFLLKMRKIQRTYIVSHHIPFIELSSMTIVEKSIKITSQNDEFSFQHPSCLQIAATIYSIYSMLFSHQNLRFNIDLDEKIRDSFERIYIPVQFTSNLASRFIASSPMYLKNSEINEDFFYVTYEMLCNIENEIEFTEKAYNNPFIPPIATAVCFGQEISILTFKNEKFSVFEKVFFFIIKNSTSIQEITFNNVTFSNKISDEFVFDNSILCPAFEYNFINCDFSSLESIQFFSCFLNYPNSITTLTFLKCNFIMETLDSLFQALFFANCFHTLEHLYMDNIIESSLSSFLVQLATCSWVLRTKCLQTFSVTNCNLNLDVLLPKLLTVDTGFVSLDLHGNNFNKNKSFNQLSTFHNVVNLDFSECIFESANELLIIFSAISRSKSKQMRVNLSRLNISQSNWSNFFMKFEQLELCNIISLIWDDNELIDENDTLSLVTMIIESMSNLVELSINNSFSKSSLYYVNEIMKSKTNLVSFSISTRKNHSLGAQLDIVSLVENNPDLEYLDITNQQVGSENISKVFQNLHFRVKDFRFSGFKPKNSYDLSQVLEMCLNSTVKFTYWPYDDVKHSLVLTDITERTKVVHKLNKLKDCFKEKFGVESTIDKFNHSNEDLDFQTKFTTTFGTSSFITIPINNVYSSSSSSMATNTKIIDNLESMKAFVDYDEDTMILIEECYEVSGTEPMLNFIINLLNRSDIMNLSNELK
ncbi:hypothetical protein TRFO_26049 [Tritrichomonas foetus]|uniref:Leucine Rich Repeat family protein n=1 Tax=Tritrichomonas foetus TaxID=1144522 RepID=A0A1J4K4T5_9EUKA|nr:hypothetical protein TRFO_26049 [Tritrichomonas foetus]|eukprot:OHT05986.1 hypothetical protein TRFO_26049 [Tritrichomonas foetus]